MTPPDSSVNPSQPQLEPEPAAQPIEAQPEAQPNGEPEPTFRKEFTLVTTTVDEAGRLTKKLTITETGTAPHPGMEAAIDAHIVRWLLQLKVQRTQAALAEGSFIDRYTEYADVIEAPRLMHTVVALQLVASLLNRNGVTFLLGGIPTPMDLWVLLLSGSGGGRNTTIGRARDLLDNAGLKLIRGDWGSPQACHQDLAENPCGLWAWGEMGAKMEALAKREFQGLKKWITDRYDERHLPEDVTYRRKGNGGDTPPIIFDRAPRINFLAGSSEAWFFQRLETDDTTGGFIPRWIIMRADGPHRTVPIPRELDAQLGEVLVGDLQRIAALTGEADLGDIIGEYAAWYHAAQERFLSHQNRELASAFWNRHRMHILKLAVVYEAASSFSLQVSRRSWDQAVATARHLEDVIFSMLDTGMNRQGHELDTVEKWFREGGAAGRTRSEFTLKYRNGNPVVRDGWLKTMQDSGTIVPVERKTGGRTADVFYHRDFAPAQQPG
jgi:hypothetical protein